MCTSCLLKSGEEAERECVCVCVWWGLRGVSTRAIKLEVRRDECVCVLAQFKLSLALPFYLWPTKMDSSHNNITAGIRFSIIIFCNHLYRSSGSLRSARADPSSHCVSVHPSLLQGHIKDKQPLTRTSKPFRISGWSHWHVSGLWEEAEEPGGTDADTGWICQVFKMKSTSWENL